MKMHRLNILVPGILAATALALAGSARAQAPSTPVPSPAPTTRAAPMPGHHKAGAATPKHATDMKAECQAMMAKHEEMRDKLQTMDIELDKQVAVMNAAKGSKEPDALEKPMAAVLNELVTQRKAFLSMMTEMQPKMMAHMAHHMQMHGAKGAMECPMMKTGHAPEPKAEESKPKM